MEKSKKIVMAVLLVMSIGCIGNAKVSGKSGKFKKARYKGLVNLSNEAARLENRRQIKTVKFSEFKSLNLYRQNARSRPKLIH